MQNTCQVASVEKVLIGHLQMHRKALRNCTLIIIIDVALFQIADRTSTSLVSKTSTIAKCRFFTGTSLYVTYWKMFCPVARTTLHLLVEDYVSQQKELFMDFDFVFFVTFCHVCMSCCPLTFTWPLMLLGSSEPCISDVARNAGTLATSHNSSHCDISRQRSNTSNSSVTDIRVTSSQPFSPTSQSTSGQQMQAAGMFTCLYYCELL